MCCARCASPACSPLAGPTLCERVATDIHGNYTLQVGGSSGGCPCVCCFLVWVGVVGLGGAGAGGQAASWAGVREAPGASGLAQPPCPPAAPFTCNTVPASRQNLLEASSKLRVEALALSQAGAMPAEAFAWQPAAAAGDANQGVKAMTAFSRLLKVLVSQLLPRLATNE